MGNGSRWAPFHLNHEQGERDSGYDGDGDVIIDKPALLEPSQGIDIGEDLRGTKGMRAHHDAAP